MNQRRRIINYCLSHKDGITQREATIELGITKLSTRICEAEKNGEATFSREKIRERNRFGEETEFFRYRIVGG